MALHTETLAVGAIWMALGLVLYMLYRRAQGLPIKETVKVVLPEPLGVEEVEYRSVLVAFRDNQPFSKQMVATAVKLASKRRRGVHIHAMITVPTNLPLDAELESQESEAQSKIEQAKLIGGLRVTGHVERIRPGQSGYAIAGEAREIKAAAIVVGLRFRDSRPLYDDTLRTVLAERPCRVIVVSDPAVDGVSRPRRPLVSAT
jgi:APA family basic amino acid/polyamine antiporter